MSAMPRWLALAGAIVTSACTMTGGKVDTTHATAEQDRKAVAVLDTQYQAAVEGNDAETIARIHHGKQIEQRARDKSTRFEKQVEVDDSQVVRVWGDTAVVTSKLWLKGTRPSGDAFDYKLWFSDTYVRTPTGWRYAFGQAGAPLPK